MRKFLPRNSNIAKAIARFRVHNFNRYSMGGHCNLAIAIPYFITKHQNYQCFKVGLPLLNIIHLTKG